MQITKQQRRAVREFLSGQRQYIGIGRSYNSAGFGTNTPIKTVEGYSEPKLCGQPYLKTNFVGKGGFSKTLYTPSTLFVEVGADWLKNVRHSSKN